MKKFLALIIVVGGIVAAFVVTNVMGTQRMGQLVADLAKFELPKDPYSNPIKVKYKDKKGETVWIEENHPWDPNHDDTQVVRQCWAKRSEGTFEPTVAAVNDPALPANQRIAAMLVLGFFQRAKKSQRKIIVETLVPQLENTGDRVAEFAAYSLGVLGKKEVDKAVAAAAPKSKSDEARYYYLAALRDNRRTMDENSPFSEDAGAVMLAALESPHVPSRKLAAIDAHWLRGKSAEDTATLVNKLLALLKDADPEISDAARESIQKKVAELVGTPAFDALSAGVAGVYESEAVHTRANAVWVAGYLNNQADDAAKIGQQVAKTFEVLNQAWANDLGEVSIKAAVAAGFGRHGSLEQKLKAARFLLEDDCDPTVADAIADGMSKMSDHQQDNKLVAVLLEAIGKNNAAAGAAGTLMGIHGHKKAHAQAVIDAYKAAKDDAAKQGLLAGAQALVNDSTAKTAKKLQDAFKKKKW